LSYTAASGLSQLFAAQTPPDRSRLSVSKAVKPYTEEVRRKSQK
jgi:hypothetical protein